MQLQPFECMLSCALVSRTEEGMFLLPPCFLRLRLSMRFSIWAVQTSEIFEFAFFCSFVLCSNQFFATISRFRVVVAMSGNQTNEKD